MRDTEGGESRAVKQTQEAPAPKELAQHGKPGEAELKTLAVHAKWFPDIRSAIEGEVQRLTQQLAGHHAATTHRTNQVS